MKCLVSWEFIVKTANWSQYAMTIIFHENRQLKKSPDSALWPIVLTELCIFVRRPQLINENVKVMVATLKADVD